MKLQHISVFLANLHHVVGFIVTVKQSTSLTKDLFRNNNPTLLFSTFTLDGQDIRGPITPLGNFVLVRIKDTLSSTMGGIILPDQVRYFWIHICMNNMQL